MIRVLVDDCELTGWGNVLGTSASESSNEDDEGLEEDLSVNSDGDKNNEDTEEIEGMLKLNEKVGFMKDVNENVKVLLCDLNLAFEKNGRQERKKKKVKRLVEREESFSNEF